MATVVGIKDPLLRVSFSEVWALQKAAYLMKDEAERNAGVWKNMLEKYTRVAVVAGDPEGPAKRLKMYQGFLDDANRDIAMADQLLVALKSLDERMYKRVKL